MQDKKIAALQGSIIVHTAVQGSFINLCYQHYGQEGTTEMLNRGVIQDDPATVASEVAKELERLIRSGLSLAESILQMRQDG